MLVVMPPSPEDLPTLRVEPSYYCTAGHLSLHTTEWQRHFILICILEYYSAFKKKGNLSFTARDLVDPGALAVIDWTKE